MKYKVLLILIILLGAFFRLYGLNWDQGYHLHPDERAIVLFCLPIHLPSTVSELLSPQSPLNPHFFAYGSLPMYLLKTVAVILIPFFPTVASYDQINLLGRFLSVIFDMGTLFIIFFLGKKLFSKQIGLLSSFFYAISVFPIQTAHFYAVDTTLTFFILLNLYTLILFYEKPTIIKAFIVGVLLGASLAIKTSALIVLVPIIITLIADFILIFAKHPHRPHLWLPHVPKLLKTLFTDGLIILITAFISFFIFEPYAFLDFKEFWRQTLQQSQMTHDAFIFPYTLQYVGKISYFYEIKNIFLWGQGPILAIPSFLGIFYVLFLIIKKSKQKKWAQEFILIIFLLSYFAIVGKFAVGWMRYMLPLYPLLCLFGALIAYKLLIALKEKFRYWKFVVFVCIGSIIVWPLSFMSVYNKPNTRVLASEWINKNIPIGATIATEYWDDGLPLGTQSNYKIQILPIYEMQNPIIKMQVYQTIKESDYIIIASNRLYAPLQRIAQNCTNWNVPSEKCSQNANSYYQQLFNGNLGFKKTAEFSVYPKLEIGNWKLEINDSSSDESFTVYDHPKVMIYRKLP